MVKMSIKRTKQSKMFMNLTVLKLAEESTESIESSYCRKGQIHNIVRDVYTLPPIINRISRHKIKKDRENRTKL